MAAYAQIVDVLFAGSKFPLGIEARKDPNNVAGAVNYDPNAITPEKVDEKLGVDYTPKRAVARPNLEQELGVYENTLAPVDEELQSGAGTTNSSITFEPAKRAAQMMERKMHDQLDETKCIQAPKICCI